MILHSKELLRNLQAWEGDLGTDFWLYRVLLCELVTSDSRRSRPQGLYLWTSNLRLSFISVSRDASVTKLLFSRHFAIYSLSNRFLRNYDEKIRKLSSCLSLKNLEPNKDTNSLSVIKLTWKAGDKRNKKCFRVCIADMTVGEKQLEGLK